MFEQGHAVYLIYIACGVLHICSCCSESIYLKNFIIRLSLLIFITVVTMFIWFTLKKHSKSC